MAEPTGQAGKPLGTKTQREDTGFPWCHEQTLLPVSEPGCSCLSLDSGQGRALPPSLMCRLWGAVGLRLLAALPPAGGSSSERGMGVGGGEGRGGYGGCTGGARKGREPWLRPRSGGDPKVKLQDRKDPWAQWHECGPSRVLETPAPGVGGPAEVPLDRSGWEFQV